MKKLCLALSLLVLFTACDQPKKKAPTLQPKTLKSYPATASLPAGLKWRTNDEPPFADQAAKKGGVFHTTINSFPLTFRLYGPNSASGGFVGYNRRFGMWGLTSLHPSSHQITPLLATHWAVLSDNRTVFYRLDKNAKWSDGAPLTADDYLFAYEFMQSPHIQAPFYNQYARDHFASVEKVDDYTLKMVSVKPSWRILYELDLNPLPRHKIQLDKNWVKKTNWTPNVTAGPYVLSKFKKGKSITFTKVKNWWGKNQPRFQGLYNFDTYQIEVVRTRELEFELFKKGKLDLYSVGDGARWAKQTDFESINKGWVHKQKIYIDSPAGARGIFFNLKDSILQDVKIRQALTHCLDFLTINKKYLYGLERRQEHFFDVYPPYRAPNAKAADFNLKKANQLLDQAGWTKRNEAGIRTKQGQPLQITISVGTEQWIKYLTFFKEITKKAGIEVLIKKLDGAALYKSFNERSYQALVVVYGGGNFPNPRQFLHSENVAKGTNNLFQFANPRADELIEIYEFDLDEKKRIAAIFELEKIIKEQALMVPFWRRDHERLLWWRYLKGPPGFVSPSGLDLDALWFDKKEKQTLQTAQKEGQSLPRLPLEADPFGLRKR